jgi:hypothetical protein
MLHQVHLVNELRELPPQDGWARHEATGRACVVCPCGLNTGFINAREACQQFNSHALENEGNASLASQSEPSVTMDGNGLTLQG